MLLPAEAKMLGLPSIQRTGTGGDESIRDVTITIIMITIVIITITITIIVIIIICINLLLLLIIIQANLSECGFVFELPHRLVLALQIEC